MALQSLFQNAPKQWLNARLNNLEIDNKLILARNSTPFTGTTTITANIPHGYIKCTMAIAIIPGASQTLTFTNSSINLGDTVLLIPFGYSGIWSTNGLPYAYVSSVTAGQCIIKICNSSDSSNLPLNSEYTFEFLVMN